MHLKPMDFEDWRRHKAYPPTIDEGASAERFRELVEAELASEYPAAKVRWDNTTRSINQFVTLDFDTDHPDETDADFDVEAVKSYADFVLGHAYYNPHRWMVEKHEKAPSRSQGQE